jgi:hypothetical protein
MTKRKGRWVRGERLLNRDIFILIGRPQVHPTTRDDKKERVVGTRREVTEPKHFHLDRWAAGPSHIGMTMERAVGPGNRTEMFAFVLTTYNQMAMVLV